MTARLMYSISGALLLASAMPVEAQSKNAVTAVRFWNLIDSTRVVIETTNDFEFRSDRVADPDRLFFDLLECRLGIGRRGRYSEPVGNEFLKQIRAAETQPGVTRVVFDLGAGVEYTASRLTNPSRLVIELRRAAAATSPAPVAVPVTARVIPPVVPSVSRNAPPTPVRGGRRVFGLAEMLQLQARALPQPVLTGLGPALPRSALRAALASAPLTLPALPGMPPAPERSATVAAKPSRTSTTKSASAAQAAAKAATLGTTNQSMTRVLGLKIGRIVLDPGHGGHDTGTIGPGGLLEKELVLDVCKRLGALIEARLGAEVVFTRSDDTFIPLERRTEMANEEKADLFLSVHANSSAAQTASGVETFYLNFTTDQAALEVAARENASSQKAVHELRDLVQKITMQDKIDESRQFAAKVQQSLYAASLRINGRTRNRGVKKAPFVVLIGASMPSVLAEIGFVSNPRDEALFKKPDYRQKVAEGLYRGISGYASTLSHFQVARN